MAAGAFSVAIVLDMSSPEIFKCNQTGVGHYKECWLLYH
ncbi:hypothetical protein CSC17_2443 [Klebsiella oxytoca]|nr:hypothetical protein CSC17_2443 [Klebsiella oxytoca]